MLSKSSLLLRSTANRLLSSGDVDEDDGDVVDVDEDEVPRALPIN
mgnify:CR=1 FL=1